jgi:predicted Zn-dependent protease with MMP-like domain
VVASAQASENAPTPYRDAVDDPDDADAFDRLVGAAIDTIPEPFFSRLGSVAIVVEDEPTPHQLAAVGARGLFGLYQGVPRTKWGADGAAVPSKITIFRGPLERMHRNPDALARAVRDVVRHEVAHHFGIDDVRLRELGR